MFSNRCKAYGQLHVPALSMGQWLKLLSVGGLGRYIFIKLHIGNLFLEGYCSNIYCHELRQRTLHYQIRGVGSLFDLLGKLSVHDDVIALWTWRCI